MSGQPSEDQKKRTKNVIVAGLFFVLGVVLISEWVEVESPYEMIGRVGFTVFVIAVICISFKKLRLKHNKEKH